MLTFALQVLDQTGPRDRAASADGLSTRCPWRFAMWAIVWLSALAAGVSAADPFWPVPLDPVLEDFRWHHIPELTGKGLRSMAQAEDGRMWFGVERGVLSYDGSSWQEFDCPQAAGPMLSIAVTAQGDVFGADDRAIWRLSGEQWSQVLPPIRAREWGIYKLTATPDGAVWVGTNYGVLRIAGGAIDLYGVESTFPALQELPKHVKLQAIPSLTTPDFMFPAYDVELGGEGQLLVRARDGVFQCGYTDGNSPANSWRQLSTLKKLWHPLRSTAVCRAADGAVWVLGDNGTVVRVQGDQEQAWDLRKLVDGDVTVSIAAAPDGTVWIGGQGSIYFYCSGHWCAYTQPQIPVGGAARISVLPTADGNVWVASEQNDLYRFDHSRNRWLSLQDLNYFAETPDSRLWFLTKDGRAVSVDAELSQGESYGVADGLIDTPVTLVVTRSGQIWAAGSQGQEAAVAWFDGSKWHSREIADFCWGVDFRSVHEARDGTLWFGAAANAFDERGQRGGVVRYDPSLGSPAADAAWKVIELPESRTATYGIGESADGRLWFGGLDLYAYNPQTNERVRDKNLPFPVDARVDNVRTTPDGRLWIATRNYGVASFDGKRWWRFDSLHGLRHNTIVDALELRGGDVLIGTDRDVSRFDGSSWANAALPTAFNLQREGGDFRQTNDGSIWINVSSRGWKRRALDRDIYAPDKQQFRTSRYRPEQLPPLTSITLYEPEVSSRGNTIIAWTGADRWHATDRHALRYSYRFDQGEWSPFTTETQRVFTSLSSGQHSFEVRARDMDFNVDPHPPKIQFGVALPLWQQPWFVGLMGLLTLAVVVGIRAVNVQRWNRALHEINLDLEHRVALRTSELEDSNRELDAFAHSVSHDLRTPLRAMEGFALALEEDYGNRLDDQGRGFLRHIGDAARRMDTLIRDLLNYSRLGRVKLQMQSISLRDVIQAVIDEMVLEIDAAEAQVSVADRLHTVRGHRAILAQIVTNLLSNALKFVPPGVRPEIKIWTAEVGADRVRLMVQDNGIGIDPRHQARVFAMFERLHGVEKYHGTGIGLAIVARGCERLGGNCGVESAPGKGSCFWIELPAVDRNGDSLPIAKGDSAIDPAVAQWSDEGQSRRKRAESFS